MPKNKKFIDRKHAVTFHLVHRSQQDPLVADENAPQRVLLPVSNKPKTNAALEKQKEDQHNYGIYFDDDYNYLQHLRERDEFGQNDWELSEPKANTSSNRINLPSSVFASKVEEDVGLLNKAAPHRGPRLDWDPDLVAAMDEDFNYDDPDNQLEDDFIALANEDNPDSETENTDSDWDSDEAADDITSLNNDPFAEEETRSRFTEYSMSSSVMHRNEHLTLLDDRFEKLYETYDENDIGALDCEEIEGHLDSDTTNEILLQYADEFERNKSFESTFNMPAQKEAQRNGRTENEMNEEMDLIELNEDRKEKWDCESILSTYSNIYNHPKLISEPKCNDRIRISEKTGMPMNVLGANKLTAKALSQFNQDAITHNSGPKSIISTLSTLSIRSKNETPEERKERKHQLKDYRHARRIEKKANIEAFKEEAKRQTKIVINNRNNVQGNRLI